MTSVDLEAAIQAATRPPGNRCHVASVLARLDATDSDNAAKLRRYLTERDEVGEYRYFASVISRALASMDVRLSDWSINRHRRGGCLCPPI